MAEVTERKSLALFPVEIACWVLCRCGVRGMNPLSATPCHCSLREGQADPVLAAGWTLH